MVVMRVHRPALLALFLIFACFAPLSPAQAGVCACGPTIDVAGGRFTPNLVTVSLGQVVTWHFESTDTTTSNQRFWDSGGKSAGHNYERKFIDAGTFAYHSTIHPDMHGAVRVPLSSYGTVTKGYSLRWSKRTSTPATMSYDIQVMRAESASGWVGWRTRTTTRTGFFNPSGTGSYAFRVRTRLGGGVSNWSPAVRLRIN